MAISQEKINTMVQTLRNEQLDTQLYNNVETALEESLKLVSENVGIDYNKLNFFMAGDHVLDTNIGKETPLVMFVSIKQNKKEMLAYKSYNKLSKRARKFSGNTFQNVITAEYLAEKLFNTLANQLTQDDKLYVTKNIVIVNLNKSLKIKIIVGYNFEGNFEYDYLNKTHTTNFLKLMQEFDKKQDATKNFYDMVRILRSIDHEMALLGAIHTKSYDTLHFIETLVYNVPDELLIDSNFYNAFLKTLNYLKNADYNNFILPDGKQPMFDSKNKDDKNLYKIKTFLESIEFFYNYFNRLY